MCRAITKGTLSRGYKLVRKYVRTKLYTILESFFRVNLLVKIFVYYVYIDSYIQIYILNKAICISKLCFFVKFYFKKHMDAEVS